MDREEEEPRRGEHQAASPCPFSIEMVLTWNLRTYVHIVCTYKRETCVQGIVCATFIIIMYIIPFKKITAEEKNRECVCEWVKFLYEKSWLVILARPTVALCCLCDLLVSFCLKLNKYTHNVIARELNRREECVFVAKKLVLYIFLS